MRLTASPFGRRTVAFRDRLRSEPDLRTGYEQLKRELPAAHADEPDYAVWALSLVPVRGSTSVPLGRPSREEDCATAGTAWESGFGRTASREVNVPVARKALTALALVTGLVVAGCGGAEPRTTAATDTPTPSASPTSSQPAPSSTPPPPPATGTVVTTGDSEFGVMLFDDRGQAIYLFDRETTSTPDCYDQCAAAWPPVITDGAPQVGGAANPALLGTTQRTDGSLQVTYAGDPLYFYANEEPGEVLCHNVFLNGGLWFVVTPEGGPAPT